MATEESLQRPLHQQIISEIWTRASRRSAPAGVPLNFLQTSCTIRLPVDPACSRSLAGPSFPGLYLLALRLLSRGLVCIGADSIVTVLCSGRPHGRHLELMGRLVLSLFLSLSLRTSLCSSGTDFLFALRFRVMSRAGEWCLASHRSRLQNLEPVLSCQPTSGRGLVVLFSPDSTVVSWTRCASLAPQRPRSHARAL